MTNYDIQQSREWWAQRWLDLLESFGWRRRLERARIYAREGKVLSLEFRGHKVVSRVQGTAPEPYKVVLSLDAFSDEQWDYVIETMSQRAIFSARLLAGEMPQNIEEVFTANGISLFPLTKFDIHSKCSCPDPANPCKHIGAVYYLLGDRFSEDPFVIFQLRGRTKEQILDTLRQLRRGADETSETEITAETSQPTRTVTPLKIEQFWQYNEPLESSLVIIAPASNDTILDVLGPILLSSGSNSASSQPVMQYLDTVYKTVSQQAILSAMNLEED
ncbi:SWIM zinc finger family protein [Funiculus sociatus GB2-A5]|uniref:SWIM zinc finger family protein n=1 Tax=Funiculus sociatus GB2-A5 TaxID=2933946 RepID=A0ABV0JI01_9CYAN|nr:MULTISPECIES: SWIM zinc finger family protein [unclassified Trichocoleus]MBD1904566.1 SWIM zinc finger family protein [Trichocoleus sp. FACHB-832]MBD2064497.1 SWIM zinc finger family protein [Trichocoleus sp. FACHB-6]